MANLSPVTVVFLFVCYANAFSISDSYGVNKVCKGGEWIVYKELMTRSVHMYTTVYICDPTFVHIELEFSNISGELPFARF